MVKSWLLDRVVGIACLSGRAESRLSLQLQRAYAEIEKADLGHESL